MTNEYISNYRRHIKFMATIDGVTKWMESYAFSRSEIVLQLADIYTTGASIEVYLMEYLT